MSRARVTSISSRSSALPTWKGDAERLTRSWAPASARSVAGGPGCQTSSQIVDPTRCPRSAGRRGRDPRRSSGARRRRRSSGGSASGRRPRISPVGTDGARVREVAVEPRRADERHEASRSRARSPRRLRERPARSRGGGGDPPAGTRWRELREEHEIRAVRVSASARNARILSRFPSRSPTTAFSCASASLMP